MPPTSSRRFAVLVPVKPPAFAKSRLADLGDAARIDLATAFAVDTVTAVLSCCTAHRGACRCDVDRHVTPAAQAD